MNSEHIRDIQKNDVVRKRLAKYMALHCVRNTRALEDLHSGTLPESESGDYSDVKVVSPSGEIPWSKVSRISDEEMKAMMIGVVNQCDQFLAMLFTTPAGDDVIEELKGRDAVPGWNDPA